jgi:hypothetical protein
MVGDPRPFESGQYRFGDSAAVHSRIHGIAGECVRWPNRSARRDLMAMRRLLHPGPAAQLRDMDRTRAPRSGFSPGRGGSYSRCVNRQVMFFLVGLSLGAVLGPCEVALSAKEDPKLRGLVFEGPPCVWRSTRGGLWRASDAAGSGSCGIKAGAHRTISWINALYTYLLRSTESRRRAIEARATSDGADEQTRGAFRRSCLSGPGVHGFTVENESVAQKNPWIRLSVCRDARNILPAEPDREMLFDASRRVVEECLGISRGCIVPTNRRSLFLAEPLSACGLSRFSH